MINNVNGSGNSPGEYYPPVEADREGGESDPINEDPCDEVGLEKTPLQHVGNTGFGSTSVANIIGHGSKLLKAGSKVKFLRAVPLLNVGIVAVETVNATRKIKEKDFVVAATHAGNAAGCAGAIVESAAAVSAFAGNKGHHPAFTGVGIALGLIGGALGIGAGAVEINRGLKIRAQTGSNRTLTMGLLDIASGVTSATGAVLASTGAALPVVLSFLIGASLFDIAGIAVDYLGKRRDSAGQPGA